MFLINILYQNDVACYFVSFDNINTYSFALRFGATAANHA